MYFDPSIVLPNGETLKQSKQGTVQISPKLSKAAQQTTVLDNLKSVSLISLGQICDDKCTIIVNDKKLYAAKSNTVTINVYPKNIIMEGFCNPIDGLYNIPITKTSIQDNNFVMPTIHPIHKINSISMIDIPEKEYRKKYDVEKTNKNT